MLVLLRMTIGWHFLYAGLWKLEQGDFSSAGFLSQAKGPLADRFHELVPDFDAQRRLTPLVAEVKQMRGLPLTKEEEAALDDDAFAATIRRYDAHYKLNDAQKKVADNLADYYREQVREYLADGDRGDKLLNYAHDWQRLETLKRSPDRGTPYVQKRIWDEQTELVGLSSGWLTDVGVIQDNFESAFGDLLTGDQQKQGPLIEPIATRFDMDRFITWTNVAIGGCLLVGLFTRLAALGGALFLLLIVLAQPDWPGLYPPPPPAVGRSFIVTKEFVEMMSLFALAALPVGRWGGLDFFVHYLFVRPMFGRKAMS